MKSLLRLKPYLFRYKRTLLIGFLTVLGSNIFNVVQPMFLGNAVDELKLGIEQHTFVSRDLLIWAGLIVAFALIAGFFTYMTRQTIIVVSRHIEYRPTERLISSPPGTILLILPEYTDWRYNGPCYQ